MTSKEFIADIRNYCKANYNEAGVKKANYYLKEGYDGYGLAAKQIYDKVKELQKLPDISVPLLLEAVLELFKSGKYDEITIALVLLDKNHKQFTREVFDEIICWFPYGINNWAHADIMGMWIMPKLINKGIIQISDLQPWLKSTYKYQRRIVPVTLIKSLKTTDNYNALFSFIEPLMMDPERVVHQGTGWFLREAWKLKHEVTEEFLLKWKNTSPRLIFQYATEKMTPENKQRFRKVK